MRAQATPKSPIQLWLWPVSLLAAAFAGLVLVAAPTAALAQEDRAVTLGRELFAGKGNCSNCHGWHGAGAAGHMGNGPSLRTTFLDEAGLIETISCGRPGTKMPYHVSRAYTESFPCYGLTNKEDLGDMKVGAGFNLPSRQIAQIVAFILAEIKGKEKITLEYCERYYGAAARNCDEYRDGA